MRKAKILVVANSYSAHTSKSLFWPDVIMLAAINLGLMQSVSMAIGVQRQTGMNPITIAKKTTKAVFALSPGYAHLRDGLKFVYAMVALISDGPKGDQCYDSGCRT